MPCVIRWPLTYVHTLLSVDLWSLCIPYLFMHTLVRWPTPSLLFGDLWPLYIHYIRWPLTLCPDVTPCTDLLCPVAAAESWEHTGLAFFLLLLFLCDLCLLLCRVVGSSRIQRLTLKYLTSARPSSCAKIMIRGVWM